MWLAGQANPENWSLVLLGRDNERLRKIGSPHLRHSHPDGSEAPPRHKHYWTEADEDHWTYEPSDFRWDDQNVALIDFAEECNIILLQDAAELHFQGDLR